MVHFFVVFTLTLVFGLKYLKGVLPRYQYVAKKDFKPSVFGNQTSYGEDFRTTLFY